MGRIFVRLAWIGKYNVSLIQVQPPLMEPVSLSELKDMLRMDPSDTSQDGLLTTLNMAARAYCETVTQRRFVKQVWALYQDWFPGYIDSKLAGQRVSSPFVSGANALLVGIRYAIVLPFPPVQTLNIFQYQDANGHNTSMLVGPLPIASVANTLNQPVSVILTEPHGPLSGATVVIEGNAELLAVCNGQADQVVTVFDSVTLLLNGILGTGSSVPSSGEITGQNFTMDLSSQPARLAPVFSQMWPVARVTLDAIEIQYTVGYATPISVTTSLGGNVISSAFEFTNANVGQLLSIPGAGPNAGCLNSVIQGVDVYGGALIADDASTVVESSSALLVNYGVNAHWNLITMAIKFLVSSWFIQRVPSFDAGQRECIAAILSPCMDIRL